MTRCGITAVKFICPNLSTDDILAVEMHTKEPGLMLIVL